MTQNTTPIEAYRILNKRMSHVSELEATPLGLSFITKKSLEQHPEYIFLKDKLTSYSKKVTKNVKIDEYEIRTFQKLYQLLLDMIGIDDKQLQSKQLKQIKGWLQEQQKTIKNRVQPGILRMMINKQSRKARSLIDKLYSVNKTKNDPSNRIKIPSQLIQQALQPYINKWRTLHSDGQPPPVRLNYYDRKNLELQPLISLKESTNEKYSMLNNNISYLLSPNDNSNIDDKLDDDGKQVQTQVEQEHPSIAAENDLPDEIILPDDIPMFGEQPDQADESREAEQADGNLDPKIKLYLSGAKDNKKQEQKTSYIYMKEKQKEQQKRLQLKFNNLRDYEVIQKHQDNQMILLSERVAKDKSKMTKQQQKTLELRVVNPSYSIIQQQLPQQFKLSEEIQKKFGLIDPFKSSRKQNKIDLSFHLPKLNSARGSAVFQRSIEKPKLDMLKKRFSNILNLSPQHQLLQQEGENAKSMVQYTSRRRAFSNVLEHFSKKAQRQQDIQELTELKQRLTSKKLGINAKALANGLCLPQQNTIQMDGLPEKSLLHNEFMVEAKKGKKKKK